MGASRAGGEAGLAGSGVVVVNVNPSETWEPAVADVELATRPEVPLPVRRKIDAATSVSRVESG